MYTPNSHSIYIKKKHLILGNEKFLYTIVVYNLSHAIADHITTIKDMMRRWH